MASELASEAVKVHFKAQACTVTKAAPFVAQPPHRVLSVVNDVTLNTDVRAQERAQFEQKVKAKEAQEQVRQVFLVLVARD